jgi:anhydro-N-acetylmuramic acid kinase
VQIGNAALLAELTGVTVVADFRSRDLAAGGQGAPLVPAFHAAVFSDPGETRAVLNLGGIANLTYLPASGPVTGFDSGPGNCLLDAWAELHLGTRFDAGGKWAASGTEDRALLARLLDLSYFAMRPPKSTGRETFNVDWVRENFKGGELAADVQATLLALTSHSVADALARWCPGATRLIVCGGGASNARLVSGIAQAVRPAVVEPTSAHGIDPTHVEALAFAWLAQAAIEGRTGNLPGVTGARGPRVLGAIYPR